MRKHLLLTLLTLAFISCEKEIPVYTVTVSSSPSEGGSVSPEGGEYQEGQTASFTATPNEFYEFSGWSGADTSTINPVSIIVDTNKSLTARFEKLDTDNDGITDDIDQCPDTPESEQADSNGCSVSQKDFELTISVEGEGSVTEELLIAPTMYKGTSQVRLTAVPVEGWELTEWTGDASGNENPLIIDIVETTNITAVFTKKDTDGDGVPDLEDTCADTPEGEEADENGCSLSQKEFELTVTIEGEGTVTEELIVSPTIYQGTSQVKLTAVPAEGWELIEWTGDATGSENPITIEIDGAKSITAVFAEKDTDGDGVPDLDDLCEDTPEGSTVNANGCHDIIYIDENGVTVKARETAIIGDTQVINDKIYKVVDEAMLREMVANDEDVTIAVTTRVTDMSLLFNEKGTFNQAIGSWDTSNVITFKEIFKRASLFNQDISKWDTGNVLDMSGAFSRADLFNQPLSSWNVSNVQNMSSMFYKAAAFNQDIGTWDTSNVLLMTGMFYDTGFNRSLSNWNVAQVTSMKEMFYNSQFNNQIGNWDVSSVTSMQSMFHHSSFNQDINSWDVSKVQSFENMFTRSNFNQPLSNWNVSGAITLEAMFSSSGFSQDISNWCVSNFTEYPPAFVPDDFPAEFMPIWGQCGEIYLDENGITVKARDNAVTGESYKLTNEGDSYKVVDEALLRQMVANDEDVTKVVTTKVTNMNNLFKEKSSFNQQIGSWDTSNVTTMSYMFWQSGFNQDISKWNVSSVSNMGGLFRASPFNQDISDWDVSNVQSMAQMFMGTVFTGNISSWDTSSLTNLDGTFYNSKFNGNLSGWDVSSVTDMNATFQEASEFNQDLSSWDTSNVTRMTNMFAGAAVFNQPLNNWNVSEVINMSGMFSGASTFNQPINNWNTSNVENFKLMFGGAEVFNQPINSWNVSSAVDMELMFFKASAFNQSLNDWNVSNVLDMSQMFSEASNFNGNISSWDVSNVTNMAAMFSLATSFNQNISSWNVSSVNNMDAMFYYASSFNQDISSWCVRNITSTPERFSADTNFNSNYLPLWGTCPPGASDITLSKYSESKSCVNGVCNVTLGLTISNTSQETINVTKIEKWVNESLITTYTSGDVLGDLTSSSSKSFSMTLNSATSGQIKVFWSFGNKEYVAIYNWTP